MTDIPVPTQEFTWIPPFDARKLGIDRREGGHSFLIRMLSIAINTGKPVVFTDSYETASARIFQFTYDPRHEFFAQGVVQLDSKPPTLNNSFFLDKDMGGHRTPESVKALRASGTISAIGDQPDQPGDRSKPPKLEGTGLT